MKFEDISEIIDNALNKTNKNGNTYLLGDFNCRTDNNSEKGEDLIEHLSNEQFKLLNNKKRATYVSPNGNSTIDLIFTNAPRFTTGVQVLPTVIRKHQKVQIGVYATQATPVNSIKSKKRRTSRKLDPQQLEHHYAISKIETKAFNANLNTLNDEMTRIIKSSRVKIKYHPHKRWFDSECKELKRQCLNKLRNQEKLNKK